MALLLLFASMQSFAYHGTAGGPIIVNGQELTSSQGLGLIFLYGPIPAGEYWYDPVSGLWGPVGGPSTAQILPRLGIGGELEASASGGATGVFINGREIHAAELSRLRQLHGEVKRGRYWMNSELVGGYEGEPARFDLNAAAGNRNAGYNRNTVGGGLVSDGGCAGYLHPDGASVKTGNC